MQHGEECLLYGGGAKHGDTSLLASLIYAYNAGWHTRKNGRSNGSGG